jgi:hypothetical protein
VSRHHHARLSLALLATLTLTTVAIAQPDPEIAALVEATKLRDAGQHDEAIAALRKLLDRFPDSGAVRLHLGLTLLASGDAALAAPQFDQAAGTTRLRAAALYNLACTRARLGDPEAALEALEQSVEAGFGNAAAARRDPDLASIRDDERFDEILARAGRPWPTRLQFWVGEWDCYSARQGTLSGRNTLTLRQNGTVIHEQWQAAGATGGPGESWNCFDRARGVWRQVWVDGGGGVIDFVGTPQDNGVLFEAKKPDALGRVERIRMFVRPIEDGRVRQTGTRSMDDGRTWQPRYDLIYVPKGQAFSVQDVTSE